MDHSGKTTFDSSEPDAALESVMAQYIRACESGPAPDRQLILNSHPEHAAELRQFFAQRDRMALFVEPIRGFANDVLRTVGPGQQIKYVGNYELLEEVARGGMGIVYKARQKLLGRIVAVKMMLTGRLANEDDIKRFQIEAQAAANLQHPYIVPIHEVGQHQGLHYFSMDFVEGRSLSAMLQENPLSPKQAAAYVQQMAEAIHYAHQQGILHRDLKPSNVLIDNRDQVRITDFGLAMQIEGDSDLTRTGQIVGTASYMPPEQAQGIRSLIGPASDVYSLGAILYECLTGRAPFRADSALKTIEQVIRVEAASPRLLNPGIARDLETICLKCLEKEPHRRYGTAQLLADDLGSYLRGASISARPTNWPTKTLRWCRQKPLITSMALFSLFSLVGVATTASLLYYNELAHRREIGKALARETLSKERISKSNEQAMQRLYDSLLAQARANRLSRRRGHRFQSLSVLNEARQLAREMALPQQNILELRNEVIACLALTDVQVARELKDLPAGVLAFECDDALGRCARVHRDGTYSIRRLSDDTELWSLKDDSADEIFPKFSPDGRYFVSYDLSSFRLWNLSDPKPQFLGSFVGSNPTFRPDSRELAFNLPNGAIVALNLPSAERTSEWHVGATDDGKAYHPFLPRLAIATENGIRIIEMTDGSTVANLPKATGQRVVWNPDGRLIADVKNMSDVSCWDVTTGQLISEMKLAAEGTVVGFNHKGDILASRGWSGLLSLWDPWSGASLLQTRLCMHSLRFTSDDRQLAFATTLTGNPQILEVATASPCFRRIASVEMEKRNRRFGAVAVDPGGHLLAASMPDGVAIWDLASGKPLTSLHTGELRKQVKFEPSGALFATGVTGLMRWEITTDKSEGTVEIGVGQLQPHPRDAEGLGLSRDGLIVVQADRSGGVVWNRDVPDKTILLPHWDARYCDISPDGRLAATGSHWGSKVKIWDTTNGSLVHELPVEGMSNAIFSPDGSWLMTNFHGNRLWSTKTWREERFVGDSGGFAFSPDGRLLAVERQTDGVIQLQDTRTGQVYAELSNSDSAVGGDATFSPDSESLILTVADKTVCQIWSLREIRKHLKELDLDWDQPDYPAVETTAQVYVMATPPVARDHWHWAHHYAARQEWRDANEEFRRILIEKEHDVEIWCEYAAALLLQEDVESYHQVCRRVLKQFGESNVALEQYLLARILTLSPNETTMSEESLKLMEKAVEAHPKEFVWCRHTLAVALYRAGRFDLARQQCEQSIGIDPQWSGHIVNWLLLAMIHQKLGHTELASEWMDQAETWIDQASEIQSRGDGVSLPVPSWLDCLEVQLLFREATALTMEFICE